MSIKKIKVSNFKSFNNIEVELGKYNILIGANASGKSNFIEIFKFLSDITIHGLKNAISMQGGVKYLRNVNIGSKNLFIVEIESDNYKRILKDDPNLGLIGFKTSKVVYKFSLQFNRSKLGYKIFEDTLSVEFDFVNLKKQGNKYNEIRELGIGHIVITNISGQIKLDVLKTIEEIELDEEYFIPSFIKEFIKHDSDLTLLSSPLLLLPFSPRDLTDIALYDFDPKLPKTASPITGKAELEKNGCNLAIVLKNIIEDTNTKRKFSNLVKDILPFVNDLGVEKFADKTLLFKIREQYIKKEFLPASLISDGTINIVALIIALYFEANTFTIIEEPERNLHPYLVSKLVGMIEEASEKKRILVSTHNPEMVKYAGINNTLLVSRDKMGFSTISKPADSEAIKLFLENDMGLDELFIQNLLEVKQ